MSIPIRVFVSGIRIISAAKSLYLWLFHHDNDAWVKATAIEAPIEISTLAILRA